MGNPGIKLFGSSIKENELRSSVRQYLCGIANTSIGDNSNAIRSPLFTIQTILFRDSSREVGLRPQILVSTTGQIINHYTIFLIQIELNMKNKNALLVTTHTQLP